MDTLAHGLWGGAVFGRRDGAQWKAAFVLGMSPDLLSFGPYLLTHLGDVAARWSSHRGGPPDPRDIPAYVYGAYDVTHSLVVWGVACAALAAAARVRRRSGAPAWSVWPFGAWALHILCDIPTHTARFFPTPFLWPLATPYVDGFSWGRRGFMLANYSALALAYLFLLLRKRSRSASAQPRARV
jgi:membrane-bound metal-dependent hydrolase YbcI (DUF457 family)